MSKPSLFFFFFFTVYVHLLLLLRRAAVGLLLSLPSRYESAHAPSCVGSLRLEFCMVPSIETKRRGWGGMRTSPAACSDGMRATCSSWWFSAHTAAPCLPENIAACRDRWKLQNETSSLSEFWNSPGWNLQWWMQDFQIGCMRLHKNNPTKKTHKSMKANDEVHMNLHTNIHQPLGWTWSERILKEERMFKVRTKPGQGCLKFMQIGQAWTCGATQSCVVDGGPKEQFRTTMK